MKWHGPIKSINFKGFDSFDLWSLLDSNGDPNYETLLLKVKGKVVCRCSLEVACRSRLQMCTYIEIFHALIVKKICRPTQFQKLFGNEFDPATMILKEWQTPLVVVR